MSTSNPVRLRRDRSRHLRRLVPEEVGAAHQRVRAAAGRPGITDPAAAMAIADEVLLSVAALLAGRTPTGEQAPFVDTRTAYLHDLATALEERGDAWQEAAAELDVLSPAAEDPDAAPTRDGMLVGAFVVALSPFFLVWDVLRGVGRAAIVIVDGVVRRLGAMWSAAVRFVQGIGRSFVVAVRRWREYRARFAAAVREARARVVAARLRARIRLRRLRVGT